MILLEYTCYICEVLNDEHIEWKIRYFDTKKSLIEVCLTALFKPKISKTDKSAQSLMFINNFLIITVSSPPWALSREDLPEEHIVDRDLDVVVTSTGLLTVL